MLDGDNAPLEALPDIKGEGTDESMSQVSVSIFDMYVSNPSPVLTVEGDAVYKECHHELTCVLCVSWVPRVSFNSDHRRNLWWYYLLMAWKCILHIINENFDL